MHHNYRAGIRSAGGHGVPRRMAAVTGGRRITVDGTAGIVHTYPVSDSSRPWAGAAGSSSSEPS